MKQQQQVEVSKDIENTQQVGEEKTPYFKKEIFNIVNKDGKSLITFDRYILKECDSDEEAIEAIEKKDWELLVAIIDIINDIKNKK